MDSEQTKTRRLGTIGTGLFYLCFVLMLLTARVSWSGHGALEGGKAALAGNDELAARVLLREAVSWYLPGASWRDEAAVLLWELHEEQVANGALGESVATLQALRSGFMAAQSVVRPDGEWIERVNERLVPLMVQWDSSSAKRDGRVHEISEAERSQWMQDRLSADNRPRRLWAVVMIVGFALWVGATLAASRRQGRSRWARFGVALGGFLLFCLGVGLA